MDLRVVRSDLTGDRLLVAEAAGASFSPDGSKLAYVSLHGPTAAIVVANADGSEARPLHTTVGHEFDPSWSPDGRRIAFTRAGADGRSAIVVVRADGSAERVAVSSARYDALQPAWRPAVQLPKAHRRAC